MATDGPEEAGREGGALVPSVVLPAPSSPECGEGPSSLSVRSFFPIFSFFVNKVGPLNSISPAAPLPQRWPGGPGRAEAVCSVPGLPQGRMRARRGGPGRGGPLDKEARRAAVRGQTQKGLRPGGARIHLAPRVPREKRRNVDVTRRQGVRMGAPRTQRLDLKNIRALVEASRHMCLDVRNLGARRRGPGA